MVNIFKVSAEGRMRTGARTVPCALGKGGVVAAESKTESDGATPAGVWLMRRVFYRPDRLPAPTTQLPVVSLRPSDGWCDAPENAAYNRPVVLPFLARHETLWRDDHVYDVIAELGFNDDPVVPGKGSAIFLHVAREAYALTEGCVALALDDLLDLLAHAAPGDVIDIRL